MTEFFVFSLREALAQATDGAGISSFLSVWELSDLGSKLIERQMFNKVAHALGVGALTREMLDDMDLEEDARTDGKVCVKTIIGLLRKRSESEDADDFYASASSLAQRPLQSIAGTGNAPGKKGSKISKLFEKNRTAGPVMDATTSLAIITALRKVDLSARGGAFYDPRDEENRRKEDVSGALNILRSWMRKTGMRPLDIFQAWDASGDFGLTRKELGAGLAKFGLSLTPDLLTLVFDHMATGYHMSYDELRRWLESTKKSDLSIEEREHQAATYIQACIRGRKQRRQAELNRLLSIQ